MLIFGDVAQERYMQCVSQMAKKMRIDFGSFARTQFVDVVRDEETSSSANSVTFVRGTTLKASSIRACVREMEEDSRGLLIQNCDGYLKMSQAPCVVNTQRAKKMERGAEVQLPKSVIEQVAPINHSKWASVLEHAAICFDFLCFPECISFKKTLTVMIVLKVLHSEELAAFSAGEYIGDIQIVAMKEKGVKIFVTIEQ